MNKSKIQIRIQFMQRKLIDCYNLTKIQLLQLVNNLCQMKKKQQIICLCGNDGTGKSTLSKLIPQMSPQIYVIQRSSKELPSYLRALRQEIKQIDALTYRYSFEKEREMFQPSTTVKNEDGQSLPVFWVMLHLQPSEIFKRISKRVEMGIYESKKCVQYYSYVYLELAAYYGMTVVDVNGSPQQNATKIAQIIRNGAAQQIQKISLKTLTVQKIIQLDVETQIIRSLNNENIIRLINEKWLKQLRQNEPQRYLYFPEIQEIVGKENSFNLKLGQKIAARWIINKFPIVKNSTGNLQINLKIEDFKHTIQLSSVTFVHYVQGQSKNIYSLRSNLELVEQHFSSRIWILLKSTIYSHTKQHTGEITDLGKVRAIGSNLFLQMLRRNNLKHAYIAINKEGIIFSRKIKTNNVQIVFKRQYVGTDKHSYNLMDLEEIIVDKDNKYQSGIYIRFDWRNPNHFIQSFPNYILNLSPYYYIIQKEIGKQTFFKKFLNQSKVTPWGDKCISEDLISNYVEISKIKNKILSLYCTFCYYCKKVGLDIIDGCFMLDSQGETVWSEINPDCMRVKKNELNSRQNYDKDIWRIGGSSSKEKILQKWSLFNKLLIDYFVENRFHLTELLQTTPLSYPNSEQARLLLNRYSQKMPKEYISALKNISHCTQKKKELIATIDISDGRPMLVKSSQLSENHSSCNLTQAHSYIKVLPKIVLVDLDAAMDKQINNRNHIKKLAMKQNSNVYGVGGGIRSLQVLKYYLYELLIPKVILSTNLELLKQIPLQIVQQRIIVELSINQDNQILTHGRKVNTHENVIKKMIELAQLGVKVVSLTFNHKEGHLSGIPRTQFRDIMFQIPGPIDKVIIAGGISSLDDLQYIWGFPKAIPQLGSAIWKHKISIADLCNQIINFKDDGLCPAIITDSSQKLLGQVFMNKQAIKMTCQTRQLHRYSRKLGRLIKKGEQSGNTQKIISFRYDCDNDCLNIIVENSENPFCHLQSQSCFDYESQHRSQNILSLQHHILRKKETGSGYSKRLQQNQHLALSKFIQQSFQFSLSKNRIVEQGADVISHMLMYLNSKGICFSDVMKELEVRSVQLKQPKISQKQQNKICYVGVMGGKHYEKIDKAMLDTLGIRVIRPNNRSLKLDYTIEDQTKFDAYFKGKNIKLIGIKSKDMAFLLSRGYLSYCFNYTIMMENSPKIWVQHFREGINQIKLVLLSRKNQQINPLQWTPSQKGRIVTEYPRSTANYFENLGLAQDCYSFIQVSGGTQSYLQIDDFDYCDAIVQSGRTISQNNLHVVKILAENIYAALYTLV